VQFPGRDAILLVRPASMPGASARDAAPTRDFSRRVNEAFGKISQSAGVLCCEYQRSGPNVAGAASELREVAEATTNPRGPVARADFNIEAAFTR